MLRSAFEVVKLVGPAGFALVMAVWISTAAAAESGTDPEPTHTACGLLTDADLTPLLFEAAGGALDSWSGHPATGLSTCKWEARPHELPIGTPPRTASLSFYHFADRDRAQAELDAERKGDPAISTALVDGDDDTVVRPNPLVIEARHGANVAVLDATGAMLNIPLQIETRHLLDALALKAVGAQIKPAAWSPSSTSTNSSSINGWTPPPHPLTGWRRPLETFVHIVHELALWRYSIIPVFIVATALSGNLWPKEKGGRYATLVCFLGILITAVNVLFGPDLSSALIYRFGQSGSGTMTGSHETSTIYNNHNVLGYDVLFRTASGELVKASFQDDDFNVYPSHNAVSYPVEGDTFTVRYLPMFPKDFVIVDDDSSPWATRLRCSGLMRADTEARAKLGAAPADPAFGAAANRADAAFTSAGCIADNR